MMQTKKILVTGSKGTVGRHLTKSLVERGHEVIGCDLFHDENEVGYSLRTDVEHPTYSRCDIGEHRQVRRLFDRFGTFDYVYNCAAEFGRWNGEDFYENLWRSNVVGLKNIIRIQERLGFNLVHFSSSEVYGDYPDLMTESVMDEHEVKQMNDYAMTKWVNEMQIGNSRRQFGTKSVIVRLFNTYGPGEYYSPYRSVNCRFLYCALMGLPWTVHTGHSRTSTYLTDTVRTLCNIIDNFKDGEAYNIGGGEGHTIKELSDVILKVTGADPTLVTYAEPEVLTTAVKFVDTSKSRRDLGHVDSCSLEEGIRTTMKWMKETYKI